MAIFNKTFKSYIINELNKRTEDFEYSRNIISPFVRVTSLIKGSLNNIELTGFTLGIPDNTLASDIDSIFNSNQQGNVVGVTYNNGIPSLVSIPNEVINTPAPGVTDVEINSYYNGGFASEATVRFKFYTKAQYDFIYQTFFRPGNPVLIEFGHIKHINQTAPDFLELGIGIFNELYEEHAWGIKRPVSNSKSAEYDYVVGLVVNFNLNLNDKNEYEGEIQIISSADFSFSMQNDRTLLSFNNLGVSRSIKEIFGKEQSQGLFKDDQILETVKRDLGEKEYQNDPLSGTFQDSIIKLDSNNNWFWGLLGRDKDTDYYLSLDYVFDTIIPDYILGEVFNKANHDFFLDGGRVTRLSSVKDKHIEDLKDISKTSISYNKQLRTTEPKEIIINNVQLYDINEAEIAEFYRELRSSKYDRKFEGKEIRGTTVFEKPTASPAPVSEVGSVETDLDFYFKIQPDWRLKNKYAPGTPDGDPRNATMSGIYISYKYLRQIFQSQPSLGASIVSILNSVNRASYGILELKLRHAEKEDGTEGLLIYDENALEPDDLTSESNNQVYVFNKGTNSETINMSFDFSLPQSIASSLLVNNTNKLTYQDGNYIAGGAVGNFALVKFGYSDDIGSIFDTLGSISRPQTSLDSSPKEFSLRRLMKIKPGPKIEFKNAVDKSFQPITGYIEFMPDVMLAESIKSPEEGGDGVLETIPSAATVELTLLGISGFRFGDMFKVSKVLPNTYDGGFFFTTGIRHSINSAGWNTSIQGQFLAKMNTNEG